LGTHRWRPSNEKPGAVSRPGLDTLFKRALLHFPRIFNQGCIPDLNTALLLRKRVSLLRSKILPLAPKVTL
jgi:hypothetical protein